MPAEPLNKTLNFPFSAVFGMDEAKKAIMCALVNGNIRTVLIRGPSGVAKTTIARSIPSISERKLINVPLNVTEEQLFGGMDVESTLAEGKVCINKGLLEEADGNALYIDDVNLMDQNLLISILESVLSKRVIIEREGVSASCSTDTLLIASMNPEDSDLSSHIIDRFDVCAYVSSCEEPAEKKEVLKRNMDFNRDPDMFRRKFCDEESVIAANLDKAGDILHLVKISDGLVDIVVELCAKIGAEGHRGDIAMINTAKALAAIKGRDEVTKGDVEDAATLCLTHRRNYSPPPPPQPPEEEDDDQQNENENNDQNNDDQQDREDQNEEKEDDNDKNEEKSPPPDMPDMESMLEEMLFSIGEQFKVIDYLNDGGAKRIKRTKSRMGRRAIAESADRTGRYARSRMPNGRNPDVAFDVTIRAAAQHQSTREHGSLSINIKSSDIREKVRERRSGCTILFLVDASGSLGVRKRMSTVKGAIMSMLKESYVKRDRIGMMAFRRDSAELMLPPTKSVEYSYRKLEELPTGGKTPLGEALVTVSSYMSTYSRTHKGEECFIVLVTDGRANVPIEPGSDANAEVSDIAERIKLPGVKWIIIDAGSGFARFDHALRLAKNLEGTYFKLDELNADNLAGSVKAAIGNRDRNAG